MNGPKDNSGICVYGLLTLLHESYNQFLLCEFICFCGRKGIMRIVLVVGQRLRLIDLGGV